MDVDSLGEIFGNTWIMTLETLQASFNFTVMYLFFLIRILAYDPKAPTEPSTTGLVHVSFKTMTPQVLQTTTSPIIMDDFIQMNFVFKI